MSKPNPKIKFNGGNPVAICNRCSVIMCYVNCGENSGEFCKIIDINQVNGVDVISTPIGKKPPAFCNSCNELLNYSLNE
jgi:hypothetical protein